MNSAPTDELDMLAAEFNTAWASYTDHVDVAPEFERSAKDRLAAIIIGLWKAGVTEGLAEAALKAFDGD